MLCRNQLFLPLGRWGTANPFRVITLSLNIRVDRGKMPIFFNFITAPREHSTCSSATSFHCCVEKQADGEAVTDIFRPCELNNWGKCWNLGHKIIVDVLKKYQSQYISISDNCVFRYWSVHCDYLLLVCRHVEWRVSTGISPPIFWERCHCLFGVSWQYITIKLFSYF